MITVNGASALQAILRLGPATGEPAANQPGSVPERAGVPPVAGGPEFGIYDPRGSLDGDPRLALRHVYVSWNAWDAAALTSELRAIEEQGLQVFVTIEPWPVPGSECPLLPGIVNGDYDRTIDDLARVLELLRGPVYVCWGHEMDQDLTERYPWSAQDPQQYVAAYRHVVQRIRSQVETPLRWVWAGVLKRGSTCYWPGGEFVDLIGLPIYSFPAWDQARHGFIRDFRTAFRQKRDIVEGLNKPLMITEFGVCGSNDFQTFWLQQAFVAFPEFPELAAVVFFQARDVEGAWGADLDTPDWRVDADLIRGLVDWARAHPPARAAQRARER
jgi:cellulose synthase (UDP-forming)